MNHSGVALPFDRKLYVPETWGFKDITNTKVWKDVSGAARNNTHKVSSGKGDRLIVCRIGSADTGLLEN